MKKIFALLLVVGILLTGCTTHIVDEEYTTASTDACNKQSSMFVIVERTPYWYIVYDRDTKCMYAVGNGQDRDFTPLTNADGTPKLWNKE